MSSPVAKQPALAAVLRERGGSSVVNAESGEILLLLISIKKASP